MGVELQIDGLAAWAPGIETSEAWRGWAQAPWLPAGDAVAAAAAIPAMLRRRLDRLGRAALQVAAALIADHDPEVVVFVSRRGEAERSLGLLQSLADGQPMSPAAFGLSVHNAIAAQYSMWRGDRSGYTALSAGLEGVEHGLLEVAARLHEQPQASALLVVYDGPVPAPYQSFKDEPDALFAWALRLSLPNSGSAQLRLAPLPQASALSTSPSQSTDLPVPLQILRQLWLGPADWYSGPPDAGWHWHLDGAVGG